jgi:hypothetical protein
VESRGEAQAVLGLRGGPASLGDDLRFLFMKLGIQYLMWNFCGV